MINFNIGILGHVDSGKTALARLLSTTASTAAFDKSIQSRTRHITLDLGFSALQIQPPVHIQSEKPGIDEMLLTFVDCPGHSSLIRTIIGGAQIIDMILLVIDAQKGIQTQTAECIVIGELLKRKLVVVVNKIDLLNEQSREVELCKINTKIRKTLEKTAFGGDVAIYNVSAKCEKNIQELISGIRSQLFLPQRDTSASLIIYIDHCFFIKGQGTVCTGTIVQGQVAVNDIIEIPALHEQRKVKSIQMFRKSVQTASMGDRIGLCVTQLNAQTLERGVIAKPGYLQAVYAACIRLERIRYYKFSIKSKGKFHVTVGHSTTMARVTLFLGATGEQLNIFDKEQEYEYLEQLDADSTISNAIFALLEFETPIFATKNTILIGSKLDIDVHISSCRIAFWGHIHWLTHSNNYAHEHLPLFKIFKRKMKQGTVQRVVDEQNVIVQNLFKKESNRDSFIGMQVELSTGEAGVVQSTFGQTSKVKIYFPKGLKAETTQILSTPAKSKEVLVLIRFKKYIFEKS